MVLIIFTFVLALFTMNIVKFQGINLPDSTFIGIVVAALVSLSIGLLLVLLYYRIVYGIIMRRLGRKLTQLQDIENEKGLS